MSTEEIDFLVCIAGYDNNSIEKHVPRFIDTLKSKCNLKGVNVFIVLRDCFPIPASVKDIIHNSGFTVKNCPISNPDEVGEDTSNTCNWMVSNIGNATWVGISHFDIEFEGDYFQYARSIMNNADIIGRHHSGIIMIRREAYNKTKVGFSTIGNLRIVKTRNNQYDEYFITHKGSPSDRESEFCLSLDVGELIELRGATLGLRHIHYSKANDPSDTGKSDLFIHHRDGSTLYRDISDQQRPKKDMGKSVGQISSTGAIISLTHFTYSAGTLPSGAQDWRIACMPNMTEFHETEYHKSYARSDDTRAVNCPMCMRTQFFKDQQGRLQAELKKTQ
jgi:hypothetical protein